MKLIFQLVLWVVIIFLGYLVFNAVYDPVKFNKVKERRYAQVIERLQDIRAAQIAHQEVTGVFANDFPSLISFLDTAEYVLTQRRDTTILDVEYKRTYNVDQYMDIVIVDTLGYASVKDSLFKDDRHRQMMNVPIKGVNEQFEMQSGTVVKNDNRLPVFEVKVNKSVILHDQDKDLVAQEKQVMSVDGVNGAYLRVGSMEEVNTNGNWPQSYGTGSNQ
ncbi:MAG TPA: hypothetical protein VLN46_01885 [Gillisia sp.]|nr:hypothetical protein [Gillisia sp.]